MRKRMNLETLPRDSPTSLRAKALRILPMSTAEGFRPAMEPGRLQPSKYVFEESKGFKWPSHPLLVAQKVAGAKISTASTSA